jgi:hypothetical protein
LDPTRCCGNECSNDVFSEDFWYTLSQSVLKTAGVIVLTLLALLQTGCSSATGEAAYKLPYAPTEQRVADILARMPVEEKAAVLAGSGWMETDHRGYVSLFDGVNPG